MECDAASAGTFVSNISPAKPLSTCFLFLKPHTWTLACCSPPQPLPTAHLPLERKLAGICLPARRRTDCPSEAHPRVLELTSAERAFLFPKGLRCSATSEPLTHREDTSVHTAHRSTPRLTDCSVRTKSSMGLKIENSGLPPMKVLISKKLHILRPAIEYVQQVSKPKKVSCSASL